MHPISISSILGIAMACTCAAILSYHLFKKTLRNKQQLLIQAAESGFTRLCHALIYLGADVNRKDSTGNTPLDYAIIHNHIDLLKLLIRHEALINKKEISYEDGSPLANAIVLLRDNIVCILLESGAHCRGMHIPSLLRQSL